MGLAFSHAAARVRERWLLADGTRSDLQRRGELPPARVAQRAHDARRRCRAILAFLLVGTTLLAHWTHAIPYAAGSPTVVGQEVLDVFGAHGLGHVIFFVAQFATVLILYTGGNTSFNGFPFLANYVASDKYLPRQLTKRGHRLAFSNGIIVLGVVSLSLIIAFNASVNALDRALRDRRLHRDSRSPGRAWWRATCARRSAHWRRGVFVNALSAGVTSIVVAHLHHREVHRGRLDHRGRRAASCTRADALPPTVRARGAGLRGEQRAGPRMNIRMNRVIVFVDTYDLPTERALLYCQLASTPSRCGRCTSTSTPSSPNASRSSGARPNTASATSALEIVDCEDRRVDRAALELVADAVRDPDVFCMVILPASRFRLAPAATAARPHAPTTWRAPSCTCRAPRRRSSPTARCASASPRARVQRGAGQRRGRLAAACARPPISPPT